MAAAVLGERLAKALATLPAAAKPTLVNRKWHQPKMSLRQLNVLRKKYIEAGLPIEQFPVPKKPATPMKWLLKPPKGNKAERERETRQEKIQNNVKNMPKIIEDWKREKKEASKKKKSEIPF